MTLLDWLAGGVITLVVLTFLYAVIERAVHGDPLPHEEDSMIRWWWRE